MDDERIFSAWLREGSLASHVLVSGLNLLHESASAPSGVFSNALFNLSIGLERLGKLVVMLEHLIVSQGGFLSDKEMKSRFGHKLDVLFDSSRVLAASQNLNLKYGLPDDPIHDAIVAVLAEFAHTARYYNLDYLGSQGATKAECPEVMWMNQVGRLVLAKHYSLEQESQDRTQALLAQRALDSDGTKQDRSRSSFPFPHLMNPSQIKNIFWDVDGVLADLNYAYFHFLTGHPNYRDRYAGLKWEQLPEVLPIVPEYGALELKTHPELGAEMDRDFCADPAFFRNRPLYPKVIEVLQRLNERGYRQFTMSATFDVEAKTAYLNDMLAPVTDFLTIECVQHGEFMHDTAKNDHLRACYQKYGLNPDETILVDDRIYNQHAAIESGAHPVRLRCEFTTDLPEELAWIPEFKDVEAVADWLLGRER